MGHKPPKQPRRCRVFVAVTAWRAGCAWWGGQNLRLVGSFPEAIAAGFQAGFLAGPQAEEGLQTLFGWKTPPRGNFARRKETGQNLFGFLDWAHPFDVYPDLAGAGQGIKGQTVGMGYVEMQQTTARIGRQCGLAARPIGKNQFRGRDVQVTAKNHPQEATAGDKSCPV